MNFIPSPSFDKKLKKFPKKIQEQVIERLDMFLLDEFNPILNNHKLHGELKDYRSINVSGDIRIVYRRIDDNACYLLFIGSHSELYK